MSTTAENVGNAAIEELRDSGVLPRLAPAREIAEELGVSEWRLYDAARRGLIPVVPIGRTIRFSRAAIAEWIASGGAAS